MLRADTSKEADPVYKRYTITTLYLMSDYTVYECMPEEQLVLGVEPVEQKMA